MLHNKHFRSTSILPNWLAIQPWSQWSRVPLIVPLQRRTCLPELASLQPCWSLVLQALVMPNVISVPIGSEEYLSPKLRLEKFGGHVWIVFRHTLSRWGVFLTCISAECFCFSNLGRVLIAAFFDIHVHWELCAWEQNLQLDFQAQNLQDAIRSLRCSDLYIDLLKFDFFHLC